MSYRDAEDLLAEQGLEEVSNESIRRWLLGNGFFVGINYSQEESVNWLNKAAELAGLSWEVHFKLRIDNAPTVLTMDGIDELPLNLHQLDDLPLRNCLYGNLEVKCGFWQLRSFLFRSARDKRSRQLHRF